LAVELFCFPAPRRHTVLRGPSRFIQRIRRSASSAAGRDMPPGIDALQKSVTALFMTLAETGILVQNFEKFPSPQLRATFLHG
jgi:hypothetical protein